MPTCGSRQWAAGSQLPCDGFSDESRNPMTREKDSHDRAQSSELGAGVGFTFEDAVGSFFLSALLDEGYAPGIQDRTVSRVAFQQRSFGEPLDDLVADFRDANGTPARLSIQVK